MQEKKLADLEEIYDLEFDEVVSTIKKQKAKKVLLQFPDAIKPYATAIVDELEKRVPEITFFIWLGSCFGACDIPNVNEKDFDLIVQFGHSAWNYDKDSQADVVS